jgi:predicted alpha/beta-fold hydrolase
VQTLLSSRGMRHLNTTGAALLASATPIDVPCSDGVQLRAVVNAHCPGAPLIVLIHGWLGDADSPYLRRTAHALTRAGFNVARLLLRDHGDSAHLNVEMFNAARIEEVVDAVSWLTDHYGPGRTGIIGFSLGGNFALRVASHHRTPGGLQACLAICPVIDPAAAVQAIDAGFAAYRWYFLRKWQRALARKQAAFPDRYEFAAARAHRSIAALTDYFVEHHTPFADAREYYGHYALTAAQLQRVRPFTRIVAAQDDPVIPKATLTSLRLGTGAPELVLTRYGGHCAFIEDFRLRSSLDEYSVTFFRARFTA